MALHKTIEMGFRRGVTKVMYPQLPGCGPPLKDFSGPLSGPLATPYLLPYDGARRKLLGIKPPLPLFLVRRGLVRRTRAGLCAPYSNARY